MRRHTMEQLLQHLRTYDAPDGLSLRIVACIERLSVRRARVQFAFFIGTAGVSILALIPALQRAVETFFSSAFVRYASLVVSDPDIVFAAVPSFAFSLAESIPLMTLIFSMGILLLFMASVRGALLRLSSARLSSLFLASV